MTKKYANKAEAHAEHQAAYGELVNHHCTVNGRRKMDDGTSVECTFVGASTYNWSEPTACCTYKGKTVWMHPKFLTKGKKLDAAKIKLDEAAWHTATGETIAFPADYHGESKSGKAVQLEHNDWFGPEWFPKANVEKIGKMGDQTVYEVPTYFLRRALNEPAVEALRGQEPAIRKAMK